MLLTKKFKANTVIFSEGSIDKTMFIVLEGSVQLYVTRLGHEVELEVIHQHEFFGESEMYRNRPRSVSAKAITDTRLIYIKTRLQLEQFSSQYPPFAGKMVRIMGQRLANTTTAIDS